MENGYTECASCGAEVGPYKEWEEPHANFIGGIDPNYRLAPEVRRVTLCGECIVIVLNFIEWKPGKLDEIRLGMIEHIEGPQ